MDKYTKAMLTIIAFSLLWLIVNTGAVFSNAVAAYADTKIEIADVTVSRTHALPVYVTGELKCTD